MVGKLLLKKSEINLEIIKRILINLIANFKVNNFNHAQVNVRIVQDINPIEYFYGKYCTIFGSYEKQN